MNSKIDTNPEIVVGHVEKLDLDIIMRTINGSKLIKGKIKRKCGIFNYQFDQTNGEEAP